MDIQLLTICALTAIINLVGAMAYAARIAGVRTRRIAMSFALFNVLILGSRLANGLLGPLLAKRIEDAISIGGGDRLEGDFRLVLMSASIAVLFGIVLIPTSQRLFAVAIESMKQDRSLARLLLRSATPGGLRTLRDSIALPHVETFAHMTRPPQATWGILVANCLAQALLTVGVLSSLYAGYLTPEYRVTASQLSAVVNGFATILLFAFIDPQLSVITDDVVDGKVSEPAFRRTIAWVSLSRLAGTIVAQALFLPAALAVVWVANLL